MPVMWVWMLSGGNFLFFLDHDDVVHPLMYERLLKAAEEQHSDIAIAQVFVLNYNGTIWDRKAIPFEKVFESDEGRITANFMTTIWQ